MWFINKIYVGWVLWHSGYETPTFHTKAEKLALSFGLTCVLGCSYSKEIITPSMQIVVIINHAIIVVMTILCIFKVTYYSQIICTYLMFDRAYFVATTSQMGKLRVIRPWSHTTKLVPVELVLVFRSTWPHSLLFCTVPCFQEPETCLRARIILPQPFCFSFLFVFGTQSI